MTQLDCHFHVGRPTPNGENELYTPTIARVVPMKNERWNSFSATNQVKAHLHQTEHPNAFSLR